MITNYGALLVLLNYGAVKLDYRAPSINYGDQKSVMSFKNLIMELHIFCEGWSSRDDI